MPRYRVIKPLPDVLVYAGGARLLLHRFDSYSVETLSYRKDQAVPYSAVVLCRGNHPTVDEQLATGFAVDAGSAADRILQSLVAKGYAEKLD